jgi:hypothetical protein
LIRIIGVQRDENPQREFVLLQNQGALRINLRGHLLLGERALESNDLSQAGHAFAEEALIPAGMYVLLHTGIGESRWTRTKDGAMVYYTYMNRPQSVWQDAPGPIHILNTQHTYAERAEALLLR